MEDDHCHAPRTIQTTRDAFLELVHLHDGGERKYIRLPRCQDIYISGTSALASDTAVIRH
jgi:hypothetical protein